MDKLSLEQYLLFWQALLPTQQARPENAVSRQSDACDTVMHHFDGSLFCSVCFTHRKNHRTIAFFRRARLPGRAFFVWRLPRQYWT